MDDTQSDARGGLAQDLEEGTLQRVGATASARF
jgi:hypothetical protein